MLGLSFPATHIKGSPVAKSCDQAKLLRSTFGFLAISYSNSSGEPFRLTSLSWNHRSTSKPAFLDFEGRQMIVCSSISSRRCKRQPNRLAS